MKKTTVRILSLLIAILMLTGILSACSSNGELTQKDTESTLHDTVTDEIASKDDESTESDSFTTESDTPESEKVSESENESENVTEPEKIVLEGEHADIISLADSLKNKVTAYFPTGKRENIVYENMNMTLDYALDVTLPQQVTSLKNKSGDVYVENTMDVFVQMTSGNRYYAKNSYTNGKPNIYRLGYYFYEMKVEGQTFIKEASGADAVTVDHLSPRGKHSIKKIQKNDGVLRVTNEDAPSDPYVVISSSLKIDTSTYTMLEFTMKADSNTSTKADIFYIAGSQTDFNAGQRVNIAINNDGEFHTYTVPLYKGSDYTKVIRSLRFDIDGAGATYEISSVRFLSVDVDDSPSALSLSRSFNIYSDKMHQVIQVATTEKTEGIEEIGIQTLLPLERVAKLIIKDKSNNLHTSLDDVDWATVEYIGFDVKDAGIFGFILPYDGKGGSIRVSLDDGIYTIEQYITPEGGIINPSRTDYNSQKGYYNWVKGGNVNDIFLGSRIYTDESHDFTTFLEEAYAERTPLNERHFKVIDNRSTDADYAGYDSLRGIYRFTLSGSDFNKAYYSEPNKHFKVNFTVQGDNTTRQIYVMTYTSSGQLECAALLDKNDVMIPVPLEVGKNFSEAAGDRNLFNLSDATYSEVIFPMEVSAMGRYEYTVLNLYQNWGRFPLKQLSWIQFFSPYYHLSTGVTETNCILPWTFTDRIWYNTLPDHRAMSAPFWVSQPQHSSAGDHDWLMYVDSEGCVVRTENIYNTIDSYGPVYADVKMDYITYDGKMKVSYTHTEMPQTDENRTYYEMTYEVLEDITINNFVTDFQFYATCPNDGKGTYRRVGYLNERNECAVVDANSTSEKVTYVLGNNCPYFSFFDMDNHGNANGYANLSFLIYNYSFVIGGEAVTPSFAIVNYNDTVYLTLNIREKTTLKAGDRFTVNAIVLPWGSQLLDDGIIDEESRNYEYTMPLSDGSLYMDKNVRDVRENTLLSPIKAIAVKNAEVIESVFMPKIKTTNGESAEFTITGGNFNTAVRVYGFEEMTVPVIYEKLGGEWKKFEISSFSADKENGHRYDGYSVHYDGDGTYSYSFIVAADGSDRTFKIVADGKYEKWDREMLPDKNTDYLSVYVDAEEMADAISTAAEFFAKPRLSEDGAYVTLSPVIDCKYGESYTVVYKAPKEDVESGQYLVIKYRVPKENVESLKIFDIYTSTVNTGPKANDALNFNPIQDGEWHVAIIDISKYSHPTFTEDNGKYYCKYIRFDFFNKKFAENVELDIAYVGMDSSLEAICKLNQSEFDTIPIHAGSLVGTVDTQTQEVKFDLVLDPAAKVKLSSLPFGSALDGANGVSQAINVGSKEGGPKDAHPITMGDDRLITLKGWCVIGDGVSKYVWSADGGLTWQDCGNLENLVAVSEKNLATAKALSSSKGYENIEASLLNSGFQGGCAITVDLAAYAGKTVDVIVAAVPAKEPDSLCLLYRFKNIAIPTEE